MLKKLSEVLSTITCELESDEKVVGAVLYGSFAKGICHSYSDIDLIVITTEAVDKMECKLINGVPVQMLCRSEDSFKEKATMKVRTSPISKDFKVILDKKGWIEDFLRSESVKDTWIKPVRINEKRRKKLAIDFGTSLDQLKGFYELDKYIEVEAFISEFVFLGLDLYYDEAGWFLPSRKHILTDLMLRDKDIYQDITSIYSEPNLARKIESYEVFYKRILGKITSVPVEYSILV